MRLRPPIGFSLLLLLLFLAGGLAHSARSDSKEQMEFGVEAAKKGLWREALFRWEKARKLTPNNARILNNLAVAHETRGDYEEADRLYREALQLLPGNDDIRENYRLFSSFYEQYRSRLANDEDAPPPPVSGEAPPDAPEEE